MAAVAAERRGTITVLAEGIKASVNSEWARRTVRPPGNREFEMVRRAFVVTDEMREKVRSLAARGVPHETIAPIVGCDPKTLRKYFRKELDIGMAEADAEVLGSLYENARGGNVVAQIFWVKTRLGMREDKAPELPDAERKSPTTIVLPDNKREPGLTEELQRAQDKYFSRKRNNK